MKCNICDSGEWVDYAGRKNIRCASCGSLERTRLMKLHLDRLGIPKKNQRILHIAPERGLTQLFSSISTNYHAVDICPELYPFHTVDKIDLCTDVHHLTSNHYDLIIHNHIVEHLLCNYTAVLYHLHRSLKTTGFHLFSLPLHPTKCFEESLEPLSKEQRTKRFGQFDHVRWMSLRDFDKTIGMIFSVDKQKFIPSHVFQCETLVKYNIPKVHWDVIDATTVFFFGKTDILLS